MQNLYSYSYSLTICITSTWQPVYNDKYVTPAREMMEHMLLESNYNRNPVRKKLAECLQTMNQNFKMKMLLHSKKLFIIAAQVYYESHCAIDIESNWMQVVRSKNYYISNRKNNKKAKCMNPQITPKIKC